MQTPATKPNHPATCLTSADCAGGRERQRPAHLRLPKPWDSLVIPSSQGDWHCAQGKVRVGAEEGDSSCFPTLSRKPE